VDVNGSDDDQQVQARWEDFGEWQRFIVEKTPDNPNRVIHKIVEQREMVTPPRRRRSSGWESHRHLHESAAVALREYGQGFVAGRRVLEDH